MNWALLAAGSLALLGSAIHGVVGDRIVRRIDEGSLPENMFRGIGTKFLIRVTWHFTTIAFLVLGAALIWVGSEPGLSAASGVAYVTGAALSAWTVFALVAGVKHGGVGVFTSHPAPIALPLAAVLAWFGATSL